MAVVGDVGRNGAFGVLGIQIGIKVVVGDHDIRGDDYGRLHHACLACLPTRKIAPIGWSVRPTCVVETNCTNISINTLSQSTTDIQVLRSVEV